MEDKKFFLLPSANDTNTIYAWGAGFNDGTGRYCSLADVSEKFDCDNHNSYAVALNSNHIYNANDDS